MDSSPTSLWRSEKIPLRELTFSTALSSSPNYTQAVDATTLYVTELSINQTSFRVQVDLHTEKTWVVCTGFAPMEWVRCASTCVDSVLSIPYMDQGDVCVTPHLSEIHLGGLTLVDFGVGNAEGENVMRQSHKKILPDGVQGVLGLENSDPERAARDPNAFSKLAQRIDNFSIYLSSDTDNVDPGTDSFLLLNGVDQDLVQKKKLTAHFVPLYPNTGYLGGNDPLRLQDWALALGQVQLDGTVVTGTCGQYSDMTTCDVRIDMNSASISIPSDFRGQFVDMYLSKCQQSSLWYVCPNDTVVPTLGFTVGDVWNGYMTIDLEPHDYTARVILDSLEQLIVYVRNNKEANDFSDNDWKVGSNFLRKYYTVFHVNMGVTLYCAPGQCRTELALTHPLSALASASAWYKSVWLWVVVVSTALLLVALCRSAFAWHRRRRALPEDHQPTSSVEEYHVAPERVNTKQ